jgi:hypothetical protein
VSNAPECGSEVRYVTQPPRISVLRGRVPLPVFGLPIPNLKRRRADSNRLPSYYGCIVRSPMVRPRADPFLLMCLTILLCGSYRLLKRHEALAEVS